MPFKISFLLIYECYFTTVYVTILLCFSSCRVLRPMSTVGPGVTIGLA